MSTARGSGSDMTAGKYGTGTAGSGGSARGTGDSGTGDSGTGDKGVRACGQHGVNRRCAGHLAATASVAALISFTYHLPLCRSTTDMRYAISSFATPDAPAGSCHMTVAVIWRVLPPGGT
jgi:hypothetical protein